jgi:hypothetical protein
MQNVMGCWLGVEGSWTSTGSCAINAQVPMQCILYALLYKVTRNKEEGNAPPTSQMAPLSNIRSQIPKNKETVHSLFLILLINHIFFHGKNILTMTVKNVYLIITINFDMLA